MARFPVANGETLCIIRLEDRIVVAEGPGIVSRRLASRQVGIPVNTELGVIRTKILEIDPKADLAMATRVEGQGVCVRGRSTTLDLPCLNVFEEARKKTLQELRQKYPDDIFYRSESD